MRLNARRHYNDAGRPVNEILRAAGEKLSATIRCTIGPLHHRAAAPSGGDPVPLPWCPCGMVGLSGRTGRAYSRGMKTDTPSPLHRLATGRRLPSILLVLASLGALGTAFASQYWGGLPPCEMCWWQRYAYMAAIVPLLPSALLRLDRAWRRISLLTGGLVFLVGAGISVFHAGVEQKWWQGFTACTAPLASGSLEDLRAAILAAPVVRCDEIPWSLFGISIAGLSAIASLMLALYAVKAAFSTESTR
ncbi:disulfide bond formation protein B [Niveispirillum fermenti]|uniref:disulfide bond formation protein B n=1 Tax=Niveispirillum fermenti TaxID=1233113 RepID=UPI003A894DA7